MLNKLFLPCKGRLGGVLLALLISLTASAQMTFTYKAEPTVQTTQSNGTQKVTLPAGTELTGCITAVQVDGAEVDPSLIVPNPTETFITDGEIETFVYDGKAYSFIFTAPTDLSKYFSIVVMSDPHIEHGSYDATSISQMQTYCNNIIKMGKTGGKKVTFSSVSGYTATAEMVFCLGDMDKDSESDGTNFTTAFQGLNEAGIPFFTMCGNHDLVPDYWEGGGRGVTYGPTSGHACNQKALSIVENQRKTAVDLLPEGSSSQTFSDGSNHQQFNPYVVTYRGINFFCGQTYWFQKLYTPPTMADWLGGTMVKYWAPDGVIAKLEEYVRAHAGEAAVWMQHYPLLAGSDCDRWWLDQCQPGVAPLSDTTLYPTVRAKKQKYCQLMNMTKNPVHFSGHTHNYGNNTYEGITDYTVAGTGRTAGAAYVVLCKEGEGVIEVKQVTF